MFVLLCGWYGEVITLCILNHLTVSLMISFRFSDPLSATSCTGALYLGNTSVEIKFATIYVFFLARIAYASGQIVNQSTKLNICFHWRILDIDLKYPYSLFGRGNVGYQFPLRELLFEPCTVFGTQDSYFCIRMLFYISRPIITFTYQLPCVLFVHGTVQVFRLSA